MIAKVGVEVKPYHDLSGTFGSDLRDRAMMLEAAVLLGDLDRAQKLAQQVSAGMTDARWLSTQETAYSLVAMARFAEVAGGAGDKIAASWSLDGGAATPVGSTKALIQVPLGIKQTGTPKVKVQNTGDKPVFARVVTRGIPKVGNETPASQGLALSVTYRTAAGNEVPDVSVVEHGTDLIAHVTVQNTSGIKLDELALTQVFPSGWQINNLAPGPGQGYDYRDVRDDRVYTYLDLAAGASVEYDVPVNASYAGRFYLPGVSVNAMYDESIVARVPGQWIQVDALPEG